MQRMEIRESRIFGFGRAWLITAAVLSACSSDGGGSGGGSSTGGSASASGGNGNGGSLGGGGKGGAHDPNAGADAGAARGGAASGGAAGSTGAGGHGPDVLDGGADADAGIASDAGTDASEAGSAKPCPLPSSFPVGTYQLDALREREVVDSYTTSCSVVEETETLTLSPFDPQLPGPVSVSITNTAGSVIYMWVPSGSLVQKGDTLHFEDSVTDGASMLSFDIDKLTGIVLDLNYSADDGLNPTSFFEVSAVGWPKCAGTDAARPSHVPTPSFTNGCSGYFTKPNCVYLYEVTPDCGTNSTPGCSCGVVDQGTVTCCDKLVGY